ncbi:CDP-glycerol--poly(glycerophosphate) glycerophosphotransferase, partial [Streptomyces sp. NPDC018347]
MPQLSVIVHGPNAQGHLTELLDSLAAHPLPDAEVIVAAVGDWARETAEGHAPETIVVPLPDGTGDAAARAAGAARASGRWLHFVHAQDGLPAGAPRLIAERTAELDRADTADAAGAAGPGKPAAPVDVLLFDHVTTTWRTASAPSRDGRHLAAVGRAARPLHEAADLLRLTPLLGNRALRAAFWHAHQDRLNSDDE